MSRALVALVVWIVAALPLCGQTNLWVSYETFGEKEGFQNYFGPGQITQDREGLLWLGGDNGLYSFDGTWFTNYRHIANNDSSLPLNVVTTNYQDKAGNYWTVVRNKGLYHFNRLQRSFRRFTYPGMGRFNIHQQRITAFLEDGPLLWMVLTDYGLACWNSNNNTMRSYKICPPGSCGNYLSASWVTSIVKDPLRDCFWLGSNDGLLQYRPATGELQVYRPPVTEAQNHVSSPIFNHLLMDADNTLWCGSWGNGLLRFDCNSKTFTRYLWQPVFSGTQNICSGIFACNAHQLWIGTRDAGLLLFDKRTGRFRKLRSPDKPNEVIEAVQCFQSDAQTMWVADQKKLYRFNLDTSHFRWYPLNNSLAPMAKGVFNFVKANNTLYTGTWYEGGFGWYDRSAGRFMPQPLNGAPGSENLQHLSQDQEGRVWIGSHKGIYLLDAATRRLLPPKKREPYFQANCFDIVHARNGNHWLATTKGVVAYNARHEQLTVFDTTQPVKHRLPDLPVYDLYEDSKGRIWMGTQIQGITCYLPHADSIIHMPLGISPGQEKCISFCEDKDGRMLFVLESLGMVILEHPFTPRQKITLCNTGNYLPTDYINQIYRDHRQRIWLYTANGLLLFDPVTKHYTSFTQAHGLRDNFVDSNPYQDSAGYMYLGFLEGFQTVHPDSLLAAHTEKLHIRLNGLLVNDRAWPQQPAYLNEVILQPGQTNIAFTFAALGLSLAGRYSYAYRLDGFDKDWNYTGYKAAGQYNNLPPGTYLLRIKAAVTNNHWVSEYFGLRIVALPAWYQTNGFKMALALLIAGIFYGVFSYRLKQVKREAALRQTYTEKINELEMRSLRAQMNPHFIFNSLSSINRYIVKSDHRTASSYLTKFSRLIRLILDNTAADYISLEKELQTLQLYIELEAMRFDNAFTYAIDIGPGIDQQETMIPSMILQPYVENAIWHGLLHKESGRGALHIRMAQWSPTLIVAEIEDNGVGRRKAKEMKSKEAVKKKSYGMQISHDRLQLLNRLQHESASVSIEDLVDSAGHACGTRVVLHIPVQNGYE